MLIKDRNPMNNSFPEIDARKICQIVKTYFYVFILISEYLDSIPSLIRNILSSEPV